MATAGTDSGSTAPPGISRKQPLLSHVHDFERSVDRRQMKTLVRLSFTLAACPDPSEPGG